MKLRGACVCRNEADVIQETLLDAAPYCDEIYVYDLGSTDGTVERVREIEDSKIRLFDSVELPFHDARHADVWRSLWAEHPQDFSPSDWYWVIDADEKLVCDPRPTLGSRGYRLIGVDRQHVTMVNMALTEEDIVRWEAGERGPVGQRLKRFEVDPSYWTFEPRFFRCAPSATWRPVPSGPNPMADKMPKTCFRHGWLPILMLHYPHRSPEQLQQRLKTRAANRTQDGRFAPQWTDVICRPTEYETLEWVPDRGIANLPLQRRFSIAFSGARCLLTTTFKSATAPMTDRWANVRQKPSKPYRRRRPRRSRQ